MNEIQMAIRNQYTAEEAVKMIADIYGMRISKSQINHAREVDAADFANRETIKKWMNDGVATYIAADIPEFVKNLIVERIGMDVDDWIRCMVNSLSKDAEVRTQFSIVKGHCYFTVEGYVFLVMRSAYFLSNEERKQWVSESHLFE